MIIDSSALVAVLTGEPAAERVTRAIADATAPMVASPGLLETSMVIGGRHGSAGLALLDAYQARLGATIVPFTEAHARAATDAFLRYGKGRHASGLNFGDCMAYAVAQAEGAPLLFVGEDFGRTDVARAT